MFDSNNRMESSSGGFGLWNVVGLPYVEKQYNPTRIVIYSVRNNPPLILFSSSFLCRSDQLSITIYTQQPEVAAAESKPAAAQDPGDTAGMIKPTAYGGGVCVAAPPVKPTLATLHERL